MSRASSPPSSLSSLPTRADVSGVGESALSALQILRAPPKTHRFSTRLRGRVSILPLPATERTFLCATRVLASRGMPAFASRPLLGELGLRFRASDSGRLRMVQFFLAWRRT